MNNILNDDISQNTSLQNLFDTFSNNFIAQFMTNLSNWVSSSFSTFISALFNQNYLNSYLLSRQYNYETSYLLNLWNLQTIQLANDLTIKIYKNFFPFFEIYFINTSNTQMTSYLNQYGYLNKSDNQSNQVVANSTTNTTDEVNMDNTQTPINNSIFNQPSNLTLPVTDINTTQNNNSQIDFNGSGVLDNLIRCYEKLDKSLYDALEEIFSKYFLTIDSYNEKRWMF